MKISIKKLEKLLQEAFDIQSLEIINETIQHAGHAAMKDNIFELTHVLIKISSSDLNGLSRIEQHRKIYTALKPAISEGLHAVRLVIN